MISIDRSVAAVVRWCAGVARGTDGRRERTPPYRQAPDKQAVELLSNDVKKRTARPMSFNKRAHSCSPAKGTSRATKFFNDDVFRSGAAHPGFQPISLQATESFTLHTVPHKNLKQSTCTLPGTFYPDQSLSQTTKTDRRSHSMSSSSAHALKKPPDSFMPAGSEGLDTQTLQLLSTVDDIDDKDSALPHCVLTKLMRVLATKKREFSKIRKTLIVQQNAMLESYAQLREVEARACVPHEESSGEVRVVSVNGWPAHDLLLLIRDDLELPLSYETGSHLGMHILHQLASQLNPIPEEVVSVCAEIMARRLDLLNVWKCRHRTDRTSCTNNMKKHADFDNETEKLHGMVAGCAENLKAKINYALELAKVPWVDRETMAKKLERIHKENMVLNHKLEDFSKKENDRQDGLSQLPDGVSNYQALCTELAKERAAREALKEVVSAAESMLRVARARIATLERQLKDSRAEFENARKRHQDLEQLVIRLYRHRETNFDARSKRLLEVSKTGEFTIETLTRQRDALELRVKELREQTESAERTIQAKEAEQKSLVESLQAKASEQEKLKAASQARVIELESKVKELEGVVETFRERSVRLVEMERRRCVEFVPSKESEPTDRETEIWKELQVNRAALSRAEEELRQSQADKDSFLNSLSRIAQEGSDNLQEKIATELLNKEHKIAKLQHIIDEQRENEKIMEQGMTNYENQLAALRLEVKRLRNYDTYSKEVSHHELQTELLELQMQVETLSRERTALVTAAASRALMLERHERSADLFARMIRARRDLAALIDGRITPPPMDETIHPEISRSLSSVCTNAADTWTALHAERARVLRLESAVLAQSLQLEREGQVRTQLERRRTMLEREVLRAHHCASSQHSVLCNRNPNYSGRSWM